MFHQAMMTRERRRGSNLLARLLVAVLAFGAVGAALAQDSGHISITYNHIPAPPPPITSAQGYSIIPPDGWKPGPATAVVSDLFFYFPDPKSTFSPSLSVVVTQLDDKTTLAEVKPKLSKALAATTTNYKQITQAETQIDGQKAWMIVSNFDQGKPPQRLYSEEYVVVRGNKVFEFTYDALASDYQTHQAEFEAAMKTIEWVKAK